MSIRCRTKNMQTAHNAHKFVMKSEDVRGSLALKRGKRYLELPGRTIICNGKTV